MRRLGRVCCEYVIKLHSSLALAHCADLETKTHKNVRESFILNKQCAVRGLV